MDIQYFQASANLKKTLNSGYTLAELLITMAVFAIDVWSRGWVKCWDIILPGNISHSAKQRLNHVDVFSGNTYLIANYICN